MEKCNVTRTRELDLCVSCEICVLTCQVGAITMKYLLGQFIPEVNKDKCIMCGHCLETCPGIDIYPSELRERKHDSNIIYGDYIESYTAYSNDTQIRKNSTSGGLITNLVIKLIRDKIFDSVFILEFDTFNQKPARLKATYDINTIFNSAKSKYIPASVYGVIKTLKKKNKKKFIIIGTPCQIDGIKKFIKKYKISETTLLFLGLFCGYTLNFNILRYFEDNYAKSDEKMIKFDFRTKEKYGWPGHSRIYFDSGRNGIINRKVRMRLKRYFKLNRCLFCYDKLNRLADISFGDCYIKNKMDLNGKSIVIIRTENGKEIFDKYASFFTLEEEEIEEILKSEGILKNRKNLYYARIFSKEKNIYTKNELNYRIDYKAKKNLLKLQKDVKLGKFYKLNKIKLRLYLRKFKPIINPIKDIRWNIELLAIILLRIFSNCNKKRK